MYRCKTVSAASDITASYICPRCRFNFTSRRKAPTARRPSAYQVVSFFVTPARSLSQSSHSHATVSEPPKHEHLVRAVQSTPKSARFTNPRPRKSSSIRDSLRAWSAHSKEITQANFSDEASIAGIIPNIPAVNISGKVDQISEESGTEEANGLFGDESDFGIAASFMLPGSLFLHTTSERTQLAVYIAQFGVQQLILLENGLWRLERSEGLRNVVSTTRGIIVPGFLSVQDMEVLKKHMPQNAAVQSTSGQVVEDEIDLQGVVPYHVILPYLNRFRAFRTQKTAFLRRYTADLESLFEKFAHETQWTRLSLEEYVWNGLGMKFNDLAPGKRSAVMEFLLERDDIRMSQTGKTLSLFFIPKHDKRNLEQVVKWAREYQDAAALAALGREVASALAKNPLTAFIAKARRIIQKSRTIRSPTSTSALGPAFVPTSKTAPRKEPVGEKFSVTDNKFIDFVWHTAMCKPSGTENGQLKMVPVTALILRAIGAYPGLELNVKSARLLLKELGVSDPWQTRSHSDLRLPLPGGKVSQVADELHHEMQAFVKQFENGGGGQKLEDSDSMKHLRKDWGDIVAFAIDTEGAQTPEDAISVEPSDDVPGAHWIHVHVSHPTAFFAQDHILSRYSRHQGTACYTVDKSFPVGMIPKVVGQHFSLDRNSPVLTISSLLTSNGQVHGVKIRAGLLRNVVQLKRDSVDFVLGIANDDDRTSTLVVGKVPFIKAPSVSKDDILLAQMHKPALELIKSLVSARHEKRSEEMPERLNLPRYEFQLEAACTNVGMSPPNREHTAYHWKHDPGIVVRGRQEVLFTTSDKGRLTDIVTQAMRLAAESCGRWLADRHIPACFLGSQTAPGNDIGTLNKTMRHDVAVQPVFVRTATPTPFLHLNMKQYIGCTSPLRRYFDWMTHEQIDSYLKAEAAELLVSGAPVQDDNLLAHTRNDVEHYLYREASANDVVDLLSRNIKLNHVYFAFFRAFHFKEAKLPEIFDLMVSDPVRRTSLGILRDLKGQLVPFGLETKLSESEQKWERHAKARQFIPVKILEVDPDAQRLTAVAVGPPSDHQLFTQPFAAWTEDNLDRNTDVHIENSPIHSQLIPELADDIKSGAQRG